jgi:hypothetical protein
MAARPRTNVFKVLWLACWDSDGVSGRKLDFEYFLSHHGVDIRLLTENNLRQRAVFRLANFVSHRRDRPTEGGVTAIMVNRGIDHYAVPVYSVTRLEATAISIMLTSGLAKILVLYLSSRVPDQIGPVCLPSRRASRHNGGRPECQTCRLEFAADHDQGRLLIDYASEHSSLIKGRIHRALSLTTLQLPPTF